MHPGTHPIDSGLVRRLIAGQFPQWAGLAVGRFPPGGTVNAMYRLGSDMVIRLPLVESGSSDVSLEQEWLPRLASHLPAPVPEVLGRGEPAEVRGDGRSGLRSVPRVEFASRQCEEGLPRGSEH